MRLIFVGPPGSGKGTQAKKLADKRGFIHISTGDLLRDSVRAGTPTGKKADVLMKEGRLVPDELVIGIIEDRFKIGDCAKGFILDGFPRTLVQAQALDKMLDLLHMPVELVILIDVKDEAIVGRITGRRSCPTCQTPYHVKFVPPKKAGICDKCATELTHRSDDSEEKVRVRLGKYHQETEAVIPHYEKRKLVRRIDGAAPPDAVFAQLDKAVPAK